MNNVIVELDFWAIHTRDVNNHQNQFVNQIRAHQMVNVSFKKVATRFASVHLEWAVTRQQLVAMVMNVVLIVIVRNIMRVWD